MKICQNIICVCMYIYIYIYIGLNLGCPQHSRAVYGVDYPHVGQLAGVDRLEGWKY